jgi:hypothetical protein
MTLQKLKIGRREYVLVAKRDFQKLTSQANNYLEDDYWTKAALGAEAEANRRNEKPIPLEVVERELDAIKKSRISGKRSRR